MRPYGAQKAKVECSLWAFYPLWALNPLGLNNELMP